MYLEMGNAEEALKAYETNFIDNPNRFNGLYGAALAAKQSGNPEKATKYFEDLLKLTENSNSNRNEIEEAKIYLNQKTI
jgi:tetratricopeptide (TPR) repeat protein